MSLSFRKHWQTKLASLTLIALGSLCAAGSANPAWCKEQGTFGLEEVLARMDETAKRLRTLSANLEYTKVTVLVDDRSTEYGQIFLRYSKTPQILIQFLRPDPKTVLLRKNKAEIYLPKMNQIQEYDLEKYQGLIQQFLQLGFGTQSRALRKTHSLSLVGEQELDGDAVIVLELVPKKSEVLAQIKKVTLWISEESWLPVQQRFDEPNGDHLLTRYTAVKVNRYLPGSTFRIKTRGDVTRVKMTR